MPKGVPVATFAIGSAGAANAALFAVALLANEDPALRAQLEAFRAEQTEVARNMTLPPDTHERPTTRPVILPAPRWGVLGGGQLGRMFVHAAPGHGLLHRRAGRRPDQPRRAWVSHQPHPHRLRRPQGLAELARVADAVTTEFEKRARRCTGDPGRAAPRVARRQCRVRSAKTAPARRRTLWPAACPARRYAVIETAEQLAAVPTTCCPAF